MSLLDAATLPDEGSLRAIDPVTTAIATYRLSATPTTHALARIVAALHARNVEVLRLGWSTEPVAGPGRPRAFVVIEVAVAHTRQAQLSAVLDRLVDVTAVELERGVTVAGPC